MKQIDLNTWDELEAKVEELHAFLKSKRTSEYSTISRPLYRGQRSYSWKLITTLERYLTEEVSVEQYDHYLCLIKPAIESYTGNKLELKNDFKQDTNLFVAPPNYEYMAYVRHHGFPSPLLDWSQSLYIALFFAFQKAALNDRVAIYAYVEYLSETKDGRVGAPQICELWEYVSTHKRHFMQQGQYTVSVEMVNDNWIYCSHEKTFSASNGETQDLLLKYTLPGAIKNQVLER